MRIRTEKTAKEIQELLFAMQTIQDYKVSEEITIELNKSYKIINCEFDVVNVVTPANEIYGEPLKYMANLTVQSTKINQLVVGAESRITRLIIESSMIDEIYNTSKQIDLIKINDSVIKRLINDEIGSRMIDVQNSKIEHLQHTDGKTEHIVSSNNQISNAMIIGLVNTIFFVGSKGGDFNFIHAKTKSINITDCKSFKIKIENSEIEEQVRFQQCLGIDFRFDNSKTKKIELDRNVFDAFILRNSCDCNLQCVSEEQSINNLVLTYSTISKESEMIFSNVKIGMLLMDDLANNGYVEFHDSKIMRYLTALNANLGEMIFSRVTFPEPEKVFLNYAYLMTAEFTNMNWTCKVNEVYDKKKFKDEETFLISVRETYRQLKSVFEKHGNKIDSLEFRKNEIDAHLKLLNIRKGKGWPRNWTNLGNYLIVWTNKHGSSFGQNIWRPFVLLFVFHLVFFSGFLLFNDQLNFTPLVNVTQDATWASISLYWQTILPTHSSELLPFKGLAKISTGGFWDLLIRISSSYFIYYFITASRKYHSQS